MRAIAGDLVQTLHVKKGMTVSAGAIPCPSHLTQPRELAHYLNIGDFSVRQAVAGNPASSATAVPSLLRRLGRTRDSTKWNGLPAGVTVQGQLFARYSQAG
jgi:hypothetical protein